MTVSNRREMAVRAQQTWQDSNGAPIHIVEGTYIKEWLVLGPFSFGSKEHVRPLDNNEEGDAIVRDLLDTKWLDEHEAHADPEEGEAFVDFKWMRIGAGASTTENQSIPHAANTIFLDEKFDGIRRAVAYLFCTIWSDQDAAAMLSLNSDDGVVIWLNSEEILRVNKARGMDKLDVVPLRLQAGRNRLLIKIANHEHDWRLRAHTTLVRSRVAGTVQLRPAGWQQGDPIRPLAGIPVTLVEYLAGDAEHTTVTTDGLGNFSFDVRGVKVPVPGKGITTTAPLATHAPADERSQFERPIYTLEVRPDLDAGKHGGKGRISLVAKPNSGRPFYADFGETLQFNVTYVEISGGDVYGTVFRDADGSGVRLGAEPGIAGIPVVLNDRQGRPVGAPAQTNSSGEYRFGNLPAGSYTLWFADTFYDGDEELHLSTARSYELEVREGRPTSAPPAGYAPEVHEIRGRVVYAGDPRVGIAGVIVRLMDESGKEIDRAVTDAQGNYVFADRTGKFRLVFPEDPEEGMLVTPVQVEVQVNSIRWVDDAVYRRNGGGGGGGRGDGGGGGGSIQEAVADISAYMPTSFESGGSPRGSGGLAGGGLQQLLDSALTEVLGRRLNADDPKLFRASLQRAFVPQEVDGRTVYQWQRRTYAVQTELGGELTGAQASLYHRARTAIDDALPLLRGMEPLITSPDQEEVEAVRAIIRSELVELVDELGAEGGPRVQRVDSLFTLLERELDRMREVFGLAAGNVITVDEERRLTDFFVIRDYVRGLRAAWAGDDGFRAQFTGAQRFLGTQLVLLSRALTVVAESVDECYRAMDAVGLGPAERQTVRIEFPSQVQIGGQRVTVLDDGSKPPPLVIEELLSWVLRFATEEGRVLIEDGGRRGVEAIRPMASELQRLVQGAAEANVRHVGFTRTRVRRTLSELADQLGQLERLAGELGPQQK